MISEKSSICTPNSCWYNACMRLVEGFRRSKSQITEPQVTGIDIRNWTSAYLRGDGQNPDLAGGIEAYARHFIGPIDMELSKLHRIAGIEAGMPYPKDREEWEKKVSEYQSLLTTGSQPPPLIVIDFFDGGLAVADGNRRYESLMRAGFKSYWSILCLKEDPHKYF